MQRGAGQGRAAGAIIVRAHNAVMLWYRHSVLVPERGFREPRLAALWPCERPMGARRAESEAGDGRGA